MTFNIEYQDRPIEITVRDESCSGNYHTAPLADYEVTRVEYLGRDITKLINLDKVQDQFDLVRGQLFD